MTGPQRAAGRVAQKYMAAFAKEDGAEICQTRTRAEQRQFAVRYGTCAAGFERFFSKQPQVKAQLRAFANAEVSSVRITGRTARIALISPGQSAALPPLLARRTADGWRLVSDSSGDGGGLIGTPGGPLGKQKARLSTGGFSVLDDSSKGTAAAVVASANNTYVHVFAYTSPSRAAADARKLEVILRRRPGAGRVERRHGRLYWVVDDSGTLTGSHDATFEKAIRVGEGR